jgi:predicted ArsR family transcriptional regulator
LRLPISANFDNYTTDMNLPLLYTFVGTCTAVKFHVTKAGAPADLKAASDRLQAVAEALLEAAGKQTGDAAFKQHFGAHVTEVMAAVEQLRPASAKLGFGKLLNALLDYYYSASDKLMGGGGSSLGAYGEVWCPFPSISSSD